MARAQLRSMVLFAWLTAGAATAGADRVVPLTEQHWRDAPATVLEDETGIPSTVIEEHRRRERARDPYPSIPGDPGDTWVPASPPPPRAR